MVLMRGLCVIMANATCAVFQEVDPGSNTVRFSNTLKKTKIKPIYIPGEESMADACSFIQECVVFQ